MSDKELQPKKVGRPVIMTDEVIQKLEYAFAHGATDIQACLYANIGKSTLYNYQEKNPAFLDRKEELKESTTLHAKFNVSKAIQEGDKAQSNWWLERKAKDEFGTRSESVNVNVNVDLPEDEKDRLDDLLK